MIGFLTPYISISGPWIEHLTDISTIHRPKWIWLDTIWGRVWGSLVGNGQRVSLSNHLINTALSPLLSVAVKLNNGVKVFHANSIHINEATYKGFRIQSVNVLNMKRELIHSLWEPNPIRPMRVTMHKQPGLSKPVQSPVYIHIFKYTICVNEQILLLTIDHWPGLYQTCWYQHQQSHASISIYKCSSYLAQQRFQHKSAGSKSTGIHHFARAAEITALQSRRARLWGRPAGLAYLSQRD